MSEPCKVTASLATNTRLFQTLASRKCSTSTAVRLLSRSAILLSLINGDVCLCAYSNRGMSPVSAETNVRYVFRISSHVRIVTFAPPDKLFVPFVWSTFTRSPKPSLPFSYCLRFLSNSTSQIVICDKPATDEINRRCATACVTYGRDNVLSSSALVPEYLANGSSSCSTQSLHVKANMILFGPFSPRYLFSELLSPFLTK